MATDGVEAIDTTYKFEDLNGKLDEISELIPHGEDLEQMRKTKTWIDSKTLASQMSNALEKLKHLILTTNLTSAVFVKGDTNAGDLRRKLNTLVTNMKSLLSNCQGRHHLINKRGRQGQLFNSERKKKDPRIKAQENYLKNTIVNKLLWTNCDLPVDGVALMEQLLLTKNMLKVELTSYGRETYKDSRTTEEDKAKELRIRMNFCAPTMTDEDKYWYHQQQADRTDRVMNHCLSVINDAVAMKSLIKMIADVKCSDEGARKVCEDAEREADADLSWL